MSFVRRNDHPSDKSRQVEIDFVINQVVNDTYCDDGVLERINSRIDKLIEVAGELAKLLPYQRLYRLQLQPPSPNRSLSRSPPCGP